MCSCKSKHDSNETERKASDSIATSKMEQVIIKGTVLNKNDNTPISGVMLFIPGTSTGSIGDDKGNFSMQFPKSEKYMLIFSADGYQSIKSEVKPDTLNLIYLSPQGTSN